MILIGVAENDFRLGHLGFVNPRCEKNPKNPKLLIVASYIIKFILIT